VTLRAPPEPKPLAVDGNVHVLHEALGAIIHLEPLVLEDEAALEEVNDLVHAWLEPHLQRFSMTRNERGCLSAANGVNGGGDDPTVLAGFA
jgi:hypothetical protein